MRLRQATFHTMTGLASAVASRARGRRLRIAGGAACLLLPPAVAFAEAVGAVPHDASVSPMSLGAIGLGLWALRQLRRARADGIWWSLD